MTDSDYAQGLLAAYEDEVSGEAYFGGLADHFPVETQRDKLALLAEVERHTAGVLLPLVERHGLAPSPVPVLHELGRTEAAAWHGGGWPGLMQEMAGDYQVYVEEFRALERMAPDDDRPALARLTRHELLIIGFAEKELAGSADSLNAIRCFVEGDPSAGGTGAPD
jgi:dimethylamine/trimethylamine dehydrogenase